MPLFDTCGLLVDVRAGRCTLEYGHGGKCRADTRAPALDPTPQPVRRSRILEHIEATGNDRARDALSRLAADQEAWRQQVGSLPIESLPLLTHRVPAGSTLGDIVEATSGLFFCGRVGAPVGGESPVCTMAPDHEGPCWI